MLNDITFGQYYPAKSVLHRLDPRAKLALLIIYIVFIFVATNWASMLLMTVSTLLILISSKVPIRFYLKNLKAVLPIVLFTSVLNALYVAQGATLFKWWIITITTGGVNRAVFMSVRIIILILTSAVLSYTTTPTELTDAIESLLSPLKVFGLESAIHTMAMMMTIALRFIPTLIEETDKIISAQKARGADIESGGLIKRMKSLLPILIPLLISSIRRAYELAEAMECRCYNGGKGRKRLKQLKMQGRDYSAVIVSVVLFAAVIEINLFF